MYDLLLFVLIGTNVFVLAQLLHLSITVRKMSFELEDAVALSTKLEVRNRSLKERLNSMSVIAERHRENSQTFLRQRDDALMNLEMVLNSDHKPIDYSAYGLSTAVDRKIMERVRG